MVHWISWQSPDCCTAVIGRVGLTWQRLVQECCCCACCTCEIVEAFMVPAFYPSSSSREPNTTSAFGEWGASSADVVMWLLCVWPQSSKESTAYSMLKMHEWWNYESLVSEILVLNLFSIYGSLVQLKNEVENTSSADLPLINTRRQTS